MAKAVNKETEDSPVAPESPVLELPTSINVRQLSEVLAVSAIEVIKQLMRYGIMANINQSIDYQMASQVAGDLGHTTQLKPQAKTEKRQRPQFSAATSGNLKPRPPVVTIMGHVNHGKTKLLDAVRKTNVMESEAGGITQHIGAYQVDVNGQRITFLDTPGHEAFTAMRAHGARVTDIAILVVAADDGVMPQTLEAIAHAKAAEVPIVVAINKIDKANANPDLVKQQLADAGLVIEEWGGDIVCVAISAKEQTGIPDLLENLLVVAEVEGLKADPTQAMSGVVVEAGMDKTKGPLATVLIQDGTLKVGDTVVAGSTWGRVKAMFNDAGKRVRKAEPATPVKILGLNATPQVSDLATTVSNEQQAREMTQKQKPAPSGKKVSLSNIFDQISSGTVQELNIIIKTDVQGSIEPIVNSLEQLSTDEVIVRMIHSGNGNITESDVMLAIASKALIVGFNAGIETGAKRLAEKEKVNIRYYEVIYNLIDDVNQALKGMLQPTYADVVEGRAEVRAVFSLGKRGTVAGTYVTEGKISRDAQVRVRRQEEVVTESTVTSLKRFKDDVKEVATGYECGVGIKDFKGFKEGDILEFYRQEKVE